MNAEDSLRRAEDLLARLEQTREELARMAEAANAEAAVDVLTELAELAREVEAELQRARRQADDA